jgi:hypothetical protein
MALILSGDTGVPASGMPTGSVIQTVNATLNSSTQTTSTSFTATGLTASITPISTTNKILILVNSVILCQSSSYPGYATIYRNSTNLGTNTGLTFVSVGSSADVPIAMTFLDSPSTTSSTAYTVYIRTANASGYVQLGDSGGGIYQTASITLLEIKQ